MAINAGYTEVTGTTTGSYNMNYVRTWMEYKVLDHSAADISANQTRIDVKLYSQVQAGGSASGMAYGDAQQFGHAGFDGQNKADYTTAYNFNNFALNCFFDGVLTVPHNADGTRSVVLQASFTTISSTISGGSVTTSTITLPAMPRATTIASIAGLYYGYTTTVTLNRQAPNLTDEVLVYDGGTPWTAKLASSSATSFTFTIGRGQAPADVAYPSAKNITLRVNTYNGGSLVGTNDYTYSWQINGDDFGNWQPSFTSPTSEPYNDIVASLDTSPKTAVAGYSKMKVSAPSSDITCKYNATVASRVVTFDNGQSISNQNTYISNVISSGGRHTFTYTVTDSRGISKSVTGYVDFITSNAPTVDIVECYRGNSGGAASESGTYIWVKVKYARDSINGHNAISYKKAQASGFSAVELSYDTRISIASTASAQNAYTVTFTVTDLLRTTTVTRQIPAEDILMEFREGGKGLGIGGHCHGEGLISIYYDLSGEFDAKGGKVIASANLLQQSDIRQGSTNTGGDGQTYDAKRVSSGWVRVTPSTQYYIRSTSNANGTYIESIHYFNSSKTYVGSKNDLGALSGTFTVPSNAYFLRVQWNNLSTNITRSNITMCAMEKSSVNAIDNHFTLDARDVADRLRQQEFYVSQKVAQSTTMSDTGVSLRLGEKGWYMIWMEGVANVNGVQQVGIAIDYSATSRSLLASQTGWASLARLSCSYVGYIEWDNAQVKAWAKYGGTGENTITIRAKRIFL